MRTLFVLLILVSCGKDPVKTGATYAVNNMPEYTPPPLKTCSEIEGCDDFCMADGNSTYRCFYECSEPAEYQPSVCGQKCIKTRESCLAANCDTCKDKKITEHGTQNWCNLMCSNR